MNFVSLFMAFLLQSRSQRPLSRVLTLDSKSLKKEEHLKNQNKSRKAPLDYHRGAALLVLATAPFVQACSAKVTIDNPKLPRHTACIMRNCPKELRGCFQDPKCLAALTCIDSCNPGDSKCARSCLEIYNSRTLVGLEDCALLQKEAAPYHIKAIDPRRFGTIAEYIFKQEKLDPMFGGEAKWACPESLN